MNEWPQRPCQKKTGSQLVDTKNIINIDNVQTTIEAMRENSYFVMEEILNLKWTLTRRNQFLK